MALRPLQNAGRLLAAALLLTTAMSLSVPGVRRTLALRGLGENSSSAWSLTSEGGDGADRTWHSPSLSEQTDSPPPVAAPFPAELVADGPATGRLEVQTVKNRGSASSPGGTDRPRRRGYEELPPPPESEPSPPPPLPLVRVSDRTASAEESADRGAPLPTPPTDIAPPVGGVLRDLVAELSLLRQDLQGLTSEARRSPDRSPSARNTADQEERQRLESLHADVRRIAERQIDLEQVLRTQAEWRAASAGEPQRRWLAEASGAVGGPTDPRSARTSGTIEFTPLPDRADRWTARFLQADPAEVVRELSALGRWNLVVSPEVAGVVTLTLSDASAEEILQAAAAALDCVVVEERGLRLLLPRRRATDYRMAQERSVAKFLQPRWIEAADLLACIQPLLTPELGSVALTAGPPLQEAAGFPAADRTALLVVDFPEVVEQVEALVADLDVPPEQLEIEAVVTTVRSRSRTGESLAAALRAQGLCQTALAGGDCAAPAAGCAAYRGSPQELLACLRRLTDVHVEATPTLRVLNRQQAHVEIGSQVGYRTRSQFFRRLTLASEEIDFLPSVTALTVRAAMQGEEMVRLQVHPRVTQVRFDPVTHLPRQETAELQTDVVVPLGETIVLGGLMRREGEHALAPPQTAPWWRRLGSRATASTTDDETVEVVILLTPRRATLREPTPAPAGPSAAGVAQNPSGIPAAVSPAPGRSREWSSPPLPALASSSSRPDIGEAAASPESGLGGPTLAPPPRSAWIPPPPSR